MYRPTDPQSDLFAAGFQLHPSAQRMLDREWAGKFRTHIFPLLLREEERLAVLYDPGNGRPNWSAARMMGLCVIQSWFRLTDRELERTLSFDIRVQHALDLRVEEAYLSRRSLSDFRLRLVTVDPKMEIFRALFDAVAKEAIEQLGLDVSRQRLDSTHVMSNIRSRGRADLFARALRRFVSQLQKEHPEGAGRLPKVVAQWYADDGEKSWFGKGGAKTALTKLAQWAVDLGFMFSTDAVVREWESYFLVTRLVAEFCVFEKAEEAPALEGDEKVQAAMPDQAAAPKTGATPAPAACPTGAERSGEADSGTAGGLASGTQGAGAAAETAGGPAAAGAEAELDNGQRSRGGRGGPAQPEGAAPKPADANGAEGEVNAASSAHPAPCEDGHERAGDPPAAGGLRDAARLPRRTRAPRSTRCCGADDAAAILCSP